MIDNEIYDLTQTGNQVQAILDNAQGMPTPQQLSDAFALKANASDVYTKNETYTKTEVNRLVGSPDQNYVTVEDYASLPATGSTDTIYRVANYDGENEQVDVTMYSEYAWNGTSYTLLCVKSQIGEVFDISDYNDATYADLSAALGADGANVPDSIRRGGMSIKFIQSSDNKYVQYRLTANEFSTTTSDWVNVESEISQLGQEMAKSVRDNNDADFSISDQHGMAIVQFKDGHINTKNFDSSKIGTEVGTEDNYDFGIKDENNNILLMLKNGGIKTKNFDSENLPNIPDVVDRYKGKIFSLLGDSISTFGTPSATNENGTYCYSYYPSASCRYSEDGVNSIQFDVEDTYWMKLIRETGMRLGINDSFRGTLVTGSNYSLNSQTRINHLGENGTPDVILVYGGANDAGYNVELGVFNTENPQNYTDAQIAALPVSTFADAYRAMLIRLMKTYPLAEIVVILPTFTTSYYTITNLDLYVEIIKEACDFFGIKYIDARCTGINVYNRATYLVDGIHPNAAGMDLLFKKIYRQLIFN